MVHMYVLTHTLVGKLIPDNSRGEEGKREGGGRGGTEVTPHRRTMPCLRVAYFTL